MKQDLRNKKESKKEKVVQKDEKLTPDKLGMTLTISEIDAMRKHFEKCWKVLRIRFGVVKWLPSLVQCF